MQHLPCTWHCARGWWTWSWLSATEYSRGKQEDRRRQLSPGKGVSLGKGTRGCGMTVHHVQFARRHPTSRRFAANSFCQQFPNTQGGSTFSALANKCLWLWQQSESLSYILGLFQKINQKFRSRKKKKVACLIYGPCYPLVFLGMCRFLIWG